jgi:hypothetical protein
MPSTQSAAAVSGMLRVVYHADLSVTHPGAQHRLRALGRAYRLVPHTPETLAAAQAEEPRLAKYPEHRPTHYTDEAVLLPSNCVVRTYVEYTTTTANAPWDWGILSVSIFCPPVGDELQEVQRSNLTRHATTNWISTAQALIFHHPDLINQEPNTTSIIQSYYDDAAISQAFNTLASYMKGLGPPSQNGGWALEQSFTPRGPDPLSIKPTFQLIPTQAVRQQAAQVASMMMIATKNDMALQGAKWTVQPGTAVQISKATAPPTASGGRTTTADNWSVALADINEVHGLLTTFEVVDAANQQIAITVQNYRLRYLSIFIGFVDADGNQVPVAPGTWSNWVQNIQTNIEAEFVNNNYPVTNLCYVGHVSPILAVYGIPVAESPGELTVTVTFPPTAVSMVIYGSGLGTGDNPNPNQPLIGGVMTGLINLGVPALMLAFAADAVSSKPLQNAVEESLKNSPGPVLAAIGAAAAIVLPVISTKSTSNSKMSWQTLEGLGEFLFNKALVKWVARVAAEITESEIEDQIPFAGLVVAAINIIADLAAITETIVAIGESPWNIYNSITATITTTVTLNPDPRSGVFPAPQPGVASTYQAQMIFQNQLRSTGLVLGIVPAGFDGLTIQLQFPNNTLGGTVKFEAQYYVGDWMAAKATSGWMANNAQNAAAIELTFIELPIPLTAKSTYAHAQILTYSNGNYGWTETDTPSSVTLGDSDNPISQWSGLALSQRAQSLGSAWMAAGMGITECGSEVGGELYAMQNVKIPGEPSIGEIFPSCGFIHRTALLYDPYPPKFEMIYDLDNKVWTWALGPTGNPVPDPNDPSLGNFYLDPRKLNNPLDQDGGTHLRQVVPGDATPFDMTANQLSWGRFPVIPDAIALHPSGNIIGVNTAYGKIFVLEAAAAAVTDDEALMARSYAGQATNAQRPGLTFSPLAVTCSHDGTIFVLENSVSSSTVIARIQAFDVRGNPVYRFFGGNGEPTPFLDLSNAAELSFLDLACVGDQTMTYLYVLGYADSGNEVSEYQVSVYQVGDEPLPNPLFTTSGVAAARIAVDMWHSMYTLNYGMTTDGQGHPAGPSGTGTGPAGRTVPSVSQWVPENT